MPARKRYTTEQIVAKLLETEKLQVQGSMIRQVCKRHLINETARHAGPAAGVRELLDGTTGE